MVVCHCKAVTDRAIRTAVESGALTPAEVAMRCGAGSRCGGCVETIESLLAAADAAVDAAAGVAPVWSSTHERVA